MPECLQLTHKTALVVYKHHTGGQNVHCTRHVWYVHNAMNNQTLSAPDVKNIFTIHKCPTACHGRSAHATVSNTGKPLPVRQ